MSEGRQSAMFVRIVMFIVAFGIVGAIDAKAAYVGDSFLRVPGLSGGWPGGKYKGWIKFEARQWSGGAPAGMGGPPDPRAMFRAPGTPRSGAGKLIVSLDKRSPAMKPFMEQCRNKVTLPEVTFAELTAGDSGQKPPNAPDFLEMKLTDVQLGCPVVAGAPEQAFVLNFRDVAWLNYQGEEATKAKEPPPPASLPPRPTSGKAKAFVMTWAASSANFNPKECPVMNSGASVDDYFALVPKDAVAKEKAEFERRGQATNLEFVIGNRGPDRMDVCALPGIVPDPGHASPKSDIARGFDLDGWDGKGTPPQGVHKHKNFKSEDGRTGIDNQFYTIDGCTPGMRPEGNLTNIRNEQMRNGAVVALIEVSGIDNEQNDDSVAVTILYSKDHMVKTADGSGVLPNFTFRVTEDPELARFAQRLHGHIENGVVYTDPVDELNVRAEGAGFKLMKGRLRIEMHPDNTMTAIAGGYQDWRQLMTNRGRNRILEGTMRFKCPGLYNAFRRAADGFPDPVTGQFTAISTVYDMKGVRAFIPPAQVKAMAQASPVNHQN